MIASLYQSGSSKAGAGEADSEEIGSVAISIAIDMQDVALSNLRVQPHGGPLATPLVGHIVEQIADAEGRVAANPGNADVPMLHVVRIETDDRQDPVGPIGRGLAVGDDLAVVG